MPKKHHQPRQVRPRIIERINLALSTNRHVDGLWIGSFRTPEDVTRIEQALLLIKRKSPLHYARIVGSLERIWIFLLLHGHAEYNAALKACVINERHIANPDTSLAELASTIVHEATHARLDRRGIEYREGLRTRIEAACFRRELDFVGRLPESVHIQERLAATLAWYRDNPDYFSDAGFRERHTEGEIEALRHAGIPDWLVRATPKARSAISWARRLFQLVRYPRL